MKKLPFLWEIGCEEIPASWLGPLIDELGARVGKDLLAQGFPASDVRSYGTPRRLVVHVPSLPEKQEDREEQVTGPPLKVARDDKGQWTKAAVGFAEKNAVDPSMLAVLSTAKGQYIGFERRIKGAKTKALLPGLMIRVLRSLSFPKFMSWDATLDDGKGAFPFGRPIRWMVALFGDRVVPLEIRVVGSPEVVTGRKTVGHRFLAPKGEKPGRPFPVSSFKELERGLKKHFVLLDPAERRVRLRSELEKLEKKAKSRCASGLSPDLVADLVEWPGAVLGRYPEEFLDLPQEVRHTVLIHHQHYFPLEGKPAFVAVTNMARDPKGHMKRGAERVVIARLRDAKFFWTEDLKTPLEDRQKALDGVLFHAKLGSYRDKTRRVEPLAVWIAERSGAREAPVRRAAQLAKCDLTTGMVGEFPELQGIMGGLYGREQGESEAVWQATYSHYQPSGSSGVPEDEGFPLNREGVVISLADKVDSLAAMFAVGLVPTGSRDPFALRRAALGAVRILLESGERLSFPMDIPPRELLSEALRIVRDQRGSVDEKAEGALEEFFTERLRYVLSRRFRYDELNAVFAKGVLDRPASDVLRRLDAVSSLRGSEDFLALSAAFKRVGNILSGQAPGEVDASLFFEEKEKELFGALEHLRPQTEEQIENGRYQEALQNLSTLRGAVDRFFDEVLVMAEDEKLRRNRLALLERLRATFSRVADLSQIVSDESPA